MSKSTYPLKLPVSIKNAAARLAKQDGVSLNQWIASAVAQKVGAVETIDEFFKARAEGRSLDEFDAIMRRVPDNPPMPGDEID
ncbi:MAG: pilus assembly protein HicB [Pseudomonadota bacterium]